MIKILHTSDIDLGAAPLFTNGFSEKHYYHRLATFNALIALALEHQVDIFIVLGQLFSGVTPDPESLAAVKAGLLRLDEQGITVLLYGGTSDNCDEEGYDGLQRYRVGQNATAPVALTIATKRVNLHLLRLPIARAALPAAMVPVEPSSAYNIGILLKDISGVTSSNPYYDFLIHNKESIQSLEYHYIAVGDRHPAELIDDGNILALCPGSPQAIDFTEKGPRYCALVTLDQQQVKVEKIEIQQSLFDHVRIDISNGVNEKELCSTLAGLAHEDLVLQVELVGDIEYPLTLSRVVNQCKNMFTYLEIVDHTSLINSRYVKTMAKENTVRGKLAQAFITMNTSTDDVDQQRIYELALRDLLCRFNEVRGEKSGVDL